MLLEGKLGRGVKYFFVCFCFITLFTKQNIRLHSQTRHLQQDLIHLPSWNTFLYFINLFNASATNVGTQFTITNTNATGLTITTTGGTQLIYSTIAPASATSRTLAQANSHIFTAILTTLILLINNRL